MAFVFPRDDELDYSDSVILKVLATANLNIDPMSFLYKYGHTTGITVYRLKGHESLELAQHLWVRRGILLSLRRVHALVADPITSPISRTAVRWSGSGTISPSSSSSEPCFSMTIS